MGYYFISIGGSGAKIMESLTHLCVAGLLPRREKLYVMAIDPDTGNGNLNRSSAALKSFETFQNFAVGKETPLFKNKIELADPFPWNPTEHDKTLDDIMLYQTMQPDVKTLYEVLYTRAERNTFLNEGFRGHPSIGAAVMAKKIPLDNWKDEESEPWNRFFELVKQDKDGATAKIFLAGSVFGGTGAAGMPTISRLLHSKFSTYDRVAIGGALVLPYFSFATPTQEQTDGQIYASSENFLTNTKAALKYYALKDNVYDSMYFIGDDIMSPVKNFSVGALTQMNDAHMVDFYGALAAIDFYQTDLRNMKKCSYINHNDDNSFKWNDFPTLENIDGEPFHIKEQFTQFTRFIFAYLHLVKPVLSGLASGEIKDYKYPWFIDYLRGIDVDSRDIQSFEKYAESFVLWLKQIETNNRDVRLIKQNSFDVEYGVKISPDHFSTCAYDEDSGISIHELWYRLTERKCADEENTRGFGRFLRTLYDCCAID